MTEEATLHDRLVDAARIVWPSFPPRGAREETNLYLKRIAAQLVPSKLSEADWNHLDKDVQDWYQEASEALKNQEPLPLPDGLPDPPPVSKRSPNTPAQDMAEHRTKKAAQKAKADAKKKAAETAKAEETDNYNDVYLPMLKVAKSEDELLEQPTDPEDLAEHKQRMLDALEKVPQEAFDVLSREAQEWYDAACEADKYGNELPDLPGLTFDGSGEPEEPEAETETDADEESADTETEENVVAKAETRRKATGSKGSKAAKPAAKPTKRGAEKAAKPVKERKARAYGDGPVNVIIREIIKNPDSTKEHLRQKTQAKFPDVKESTIGGAAYYARAVIAMVKESGHWAD